MKPNKLMVLIIASLMSFAQASLADGNLSEERGTEIKKAWNSLSPEQATVANARLQEVLALETNKDGFKKVSLLGITAFACVGVQGGIMVMDVTVLKCLATSGETFSISAVGAFKMSAVLAGNSAVGYFTGDLKEGTRGYTFSAGAYYKIGGGVIVADDFLIVASGLGMGAHFDTGAESMFGGGNIMIKKD